MTGCTIAESNENGDIKTNGTEKKNDTYDSMEADSYFMGGRGGGGPWPSIIARWFKEPIRYICPSCKFIVTKI